jgi:hypothetical protein
LIVRSESRGRSITIVTRSVLALTLAAACPAHAPAQDGTATGTLRLGDRTAALRYAYASARQDFIDKTMEAIHVLLSDVPLSESARNDLFTLIGLGRKGQATILEVAIDAKGQPITGAIYAAAVNGMLSLSGIHEFERERFDRTGISGRLRTRAPTDVAKVTFEYDVRFSAAISRPNDKERAASLSSPPAVAAAAYLRALATGDIDAFRRALTNNRAKAYAGAAGVERFNTLRASLPADSRVASVLQQTATNARVGVEGYQGGSIVESVLLLTLEKGAWKVDQ